MKKQSAISNKQSAVRVAAATSRQAIGRRAFTLVELLVVISVIALALTITLPGVIGLFTAGSDLQARNVIGAMMGAARGVAVENQSYALVHVQIGIDGKCWAAVMQYDSTTDKFVPAGGFPPRQMPADMAFGEITSGYLTVTGDSYNAAMTNDAGLKNFTTFNVIFAPDGSLTTKVNGVVPQIETNVKIFGGDGATPKQEIWDGTGPPAGPELNEDGVRAITAFHYRTLEAMSNNRQGWLEKNGQFLCINQYTGKLLMTKQ